MRCFAMNQTQEGQAFLRIGNEAAHARRHVRQPSLGIKTVVEAVSLRHGVLQQLTQFGLA